MRAVQQQIVPPVWPRLERFKKHARSVLAVGEAKLYGVAR